MIKKLSLIKDEEEEFDEIEFQKAYKEMATKMGLSLDPDDPKHFYDYRALYKETGKLEPDVTGHFPSKYKKEGHPEMVVKGIDTKTGIPEEEIKPGWKQRTRGIGELPKYEIPKAIELKPTGKIGLGVGAKAETGLTLPSKPEGIFKPPEIKKLGLIKEKEKVSPAEPEEEEFASPMDKINYYKSKIDWLEDIAKKKGYLGGSGHDAYRYAIEQYNKAVNEHNKSIEIGKEFLKPKREIPPYSATSIAEQLKGKTYLSSVGEEIKKDSAIAGTVATFGMMLTKIPKQVAVGVLQASQGKEGASVINKDWADEYIRKANEDIEGFVKEAKAKYGDKAFMGLKISDLAELPQNMGYSLTSMGAGLAVGVPLSFVPLPGFRAGAYILGTVASGKVAYNATTYQIMQQYLDLKSEESRSKTGKELTLAEENRLKKEFDNLASQYGLWEAIPEAISNLAFIGILTAPLTKMVGKTIAGKIVTKLSGLYGEELITETITQMGQAGIESKVGMRAEKARAWASPRDWVASLKEVAPQTFLLTSLMAGAGSTIIKTKEAFSKAESSLKNEVGEEHPLYNKLIEGLKIQLEDLGFMPRELETAFAYKAKEKAPKEIKIAEEKLAKINKEIEDVETLRVKPKQPKEVRLKTLNKERVKTEKEIEVLRAEIKEPAKVELTEKEIVPATIEEAKEILKVDVKKTSIPKDKLAEQMVAKKVSLADIEAVKGEKIDVTKPKDIFIALRDIKAVKKEAIVEPTPKAIPKEPETFEETSKFLYNKPFKELNKSELNKVLETSKQPLPDDTGEYVNKIGTPAKGLELRPTDDANAMFIFGGFEKGLLTDSHLLVLDESVSKAVLSDLIEKYKKARVKDVQTAEVSYKEAQKIVDKEVEGYKKEFIKRFPDTEKIVPKEDIGKATPLWIQGHQITELGPPITILTDGKIQVALDTNKLAFLNKHFPNAEIKATGIDKPVLFMEGKDLKAVVMPIRVEEYPFKITGEPTITKPTAEVKPTIKKISKIKTTAKPTIQPISPEEIAERGRLIKKIHTIKSAKGLTDKEYKGIKRKIKEKYKIPWITLTRMNLDQLKDVAKSMERARPKRIGYQEVITRKTEGKIQSLKDSLVEKYQMTEKAYEDTLKDLGIYKEPRYIDAKHFIAEEKGKELIYRLIDEANILKITEPLRIALEKNPEIKKLADIIDRRVKLEGERTLKDPSDLNSARNYFQILETISGAPFFSLYQDLINTHLENRADLNHLIEGFNEYRDIIKEERELKKVEDYILAKSDLKGKPETPANITPKEIELAKKIEGILKGYQSRARTEKFLDNLEHLEKMPQYLEFKKDIDKAKDIYESKGYDDLVKYMETQKWGVIKSGYSPLQVVSAKIREYKSKGLSIIFGKEHIKVRKDIEYKEQETNVITRVISYKRQMDNLSVMAPKVRALITLANKNLSKFKNPGRVKSNLQIFFRELKGYDRSAGWFERGINRIYAQAMTTIIMGSPALSLRNLGQNLGLGHDKMMLVDPRNKKLTPDQIVYLDTYVQQAIFMQTDWFMAGEKPLGFKIGKVQIGLERLTNLIKKINLYPRSDVANRHWGFWGKVNQVRMAFEDKNIDLKKKTQKAKFSDFSLLEQKRALQILAKDGQEAMNNYVAKVYVDDVHFLYERAQRSLAEMGSYGKVFGNLMLFPRAYWEKLAKFSKKMTGKYVPFNERTRAFKVIASVLIGGALVGVAYTKTTGRRKPPYDPLVLLAYQTGGLMIGTVEALNEVYVETINAVRGDKRALATLTSSVPALADHLIPFYNYMLRGYEAFLGDPLVNKNIDVYALKKLRQLVDNEYKIRGGIHSVERNALEKWQYFLSGAGVDVAIAERKKKEREAEPIIIGKPKIPKLGIPKISKPGIRKLSPIKKF